METTSKDNNFSHKIFTREIYSSKEDNEESGSVSSGTVEKVKNWDLDFNNKKYHEDFVHGEKNETALSTRESEPCDKFKDDDTIRTIKSLFSGSQV